MSYRVILFAFCLFGLTLAACTSDAPTPENTQESTLATLPSLTGTEQFTMLIAGVDVGGMTVTHANDATQIAFEFRNNGRGPTLNETIRIGTDGLPDIWTIDGATTFGSKVEETFSVEAPVATWTDTTGTSTREDASTSLYIAQNPSPYATWLYARLLQANPGKDLSLLPGGTLGLKKIDALTVTNVTDETQIGSYEFSGLGLNPTYFLMTSNGRYFGTITPGSALLLEGYEGEEKRLRDLATEYSARRFEDIQKLATQSFEGPVRIQNVRIFDPDTLALTTPRSVLFQDGVITAIETPAASSITETVINGNGGALVPGLFEMHGHIGQNSALLNVAAGITTVRDMGNNDEVLTELIHKIETGRLVGPRIIRSGFIEGKSPFSSNTGQLVSTQAEAVDAVRKYGGKDFHQIKIYNSMKGEWVPAMVEEARKHGLRVSGHVPAFSTANDMIVAGYDELTHINQVVLGWVLEKDEDPRTLLRVTAMKRLQDLDLDDPRVEETLSAMVENNVAIDPTLAIFDVFFNGRNGVLNPAMADFVDHLPVSEQRQSKTAYLKLETPEDDEAYKIAFKKLVQLVAKMYDAGIQLVPGTDLGGSFYHHRELELYQDVGMSPAEVLAWGTQGMADYIGQGDTLGSIEVGKYADFFLIPGDPTQDFKAIKTISMVVKDGNVYFPEDIYPAFGIKPFAKAPEITQNGE